MSVPIGNPLASQGIYPTANTATQESQRVSYDPNKKIFGPMKTSVTRNIDVMTRTSTQVRQVPVPTDYTSPAFLTRIDTQLDSEAELLETNTQGVNVNYTLKLLDSVRSAQRAL